MSPGRQELEAARSSDCGLSASSSANSAGVGGGVVGGFVAGVLITIVLAVIILFLIGWKWYTLLFVVCSCCTWTWSHPAPCMVVGHTDLTISCIFVSLEALGHN